MAYSLFFLRVLISMYVIEWRCLLIAVILLHDYRKISELGLIMEEERALMTFDRLCQYLFICLFFAKNALQHATSSISEWVLMHTGQLWPFAYSNLSLTCFCLRHSFFFPPLFLRLSRLMFKFLHCMPSEYAVFLMHNIHRSVDGYCSLRKNPWLKSFFFSWSCFE